jgi:ankyrin repeat protein
MVPIRARFSPPLRLALASLLLTAALPSSRAEELPIGSRFAVAIEKGDLDAVKELVEGGAPPDTPIDYGENRLSPLMKAAWEGELEIASYLIEKGANVNFSNQDKETPLHQAIGREQVDLVRLLIEKGAKVNVADVRSFTPLHKAAAAGNVEIMKLLVGAKADMNAEMYGLTPLMFAVSSRKPEAVLALLDLGANVNYACRKGNVGQTALYSAIQAGDVDMVKLLLARKANPNAKTKAGETLLQEARKGDQDDIVALLKAAGAKK